MKRAYHFEMSDKYREKVTVPQNASFELLNLKIWAKIFDLSASPNFSRFSIYFEKLRERANEDSYNIESFFLFSRALWQLSFDY
jgi:hypothetical protein